ncbi:MAG: signal peptidase I [Nocardioidaceae bacterium]|nr:signal peptidase I [Nocardioidaceae bacterium]
MRPDAVDEEATGAWWWVRTISTALALMVALALLAVMVVVPRLGGGTPFTILTGSMVPSYPPGTLVVTRPVPIDEIGVGTPITYQLRSGEPTVVTHRVVSIGIGPDGQKQLTTQGDANNAPDEDPVSPEQVRGAVWYAVPWLGHLNNALTGRQHQLLVWVVAAGLLAYAGFMLTSAALDRGRGRRTRRDEVRR